MFLESLWSCAPPPIVVSFLQWGVNFIKYVQRNPEVSSIKSFVGIQLHPNWLNACNLRFASNVGLSYNVCNTVKEMCLPWFNEGHIGFNIATLRFIYRFEAFYNTLTVVMLISIFVIHASIMLVGALIKVYEIDLICWSTL